MTIAWKSTESTHKYIIIGLYLNWGEIVTSEMIATKMQYDSLRHSKMQHNGTEIIYKQLEILNVVFGDISSHQSVISRPILSVTQMTNV